MKPTSLNLMQRKISVVIFRAVLEAVKNKIL